MGNYSPRIALKRKQALIPKIRTVFNPMTENYFGP